MYKALSASFLLHLVLIVFGLSTFGITKRDDQILETVFVSIEVDYSNDIRSEMQSEVPVQDVADAAASSPLPERKQTTVASSPHPPSKFLETQIKTRKKHYPQTDTTTGSGNRDITPFPVIREAQNKPPLTPSDAQEVQVEDVEQGPEERTESAGVQNPSVPASDAKLPSPVAAPTFGGSDVDQSSERPEAVEDAYLLSVEKVDRRLQDDVISEGVGQENYPTLTNGEHIVDDRDDNRLSANELSYIKQQIESCWVVPPSASHLEVTKVELRILFDRDSTVTSVDILEVARAGRSPTFRAIAESAQRAVLNCTLSLPPEKYEQWRDMILVFDASNAVGG